MSAATHLQTRSLPTRPGLVSSGGHPESWPAGPLPLEVSLPASATASGLAIGVNVFGRWRLLKAQEFLSTRRKCLSTCAGHYFKPSTRINQFHPHNKPMSSALVFRQFEQMRKGDVERLRHMPKVARASKRQMRQRTQAARLHGPLFSSSYLHPEGLLLGKVVYKSFLQEP